MKNIHMPYVDRMTLVMQDWYGNKKTWQYDTYTTSMLGRKNILYTVGMHNILTVHTIKNLKEILTSGRIQ